MEDGVEAIILGTSAVGVPAIVFGICLLIRMRAMPETESAQRTHVDDLADRVSSIEQSIEEIERILKQRTAQP